MADLECPSTGQACVYAEFCDMQKSLVEGCADEQVASLASAATSLEVGEMVRNYCSSIRLEGLTEVMGSTTDSLAFYSAQDLAQAIRVGRALSRNSSPVNHL